MPKPTKNNKKHSAMKLVSLSITHTGILSVCPAISPRMKKPTTIKLPFILRLLSSLA